MPTEGATNMLNPINYACHTYYDLIIRNRHICQLSSDWQRAFHSLWLCLKNKIGPEDQIHRIIKDDWHLITAWHIRFSERNHNVTVSMPDRHCEATPTAVKWKDDQWNLLYVLWPRSPCDHSSTCSTSALQSWHCWKGGGFFNLCAIHAAQTTSVYLITWCFHLHDTSNCTAEDKLLVNEPNSQSQNKQMVTLLSSHSFFHAHFNQDFYYQTNIGLIYEPLCVHSSACAWSKIRNEPLFTVTHKMNQS